jgi:2-polyprenyl-3-methyl-5-hydroxy-6-metoxy-1,4-benzoquinol methylase
MDGLYPQAVEPTAEIERDARRRRALERSRLFDREAERDDRCRPSYPDAMVDALLGQQPSGLNVLDVGCGTGIASRLMAERGAQVLGVEVAPRMAEIAHRYRIDVDDRPVREYGGL